MILTKFDQRHEYVFGLTFANGAVMETDLAPLISQQVSISDQDSARIDPEFGCLEFNNGAVDIEPKTLYHWAESHNLCHP